MQNNLLLVAITHLDSAVYSVTYQMKILTTALFSVFLLNRRLSLRQWLALVIIVPGVGLVELSSKTSTAKTVTTEQHPLLGFICIVICSFTSGFSGVFFEKVLKGKKHNNIWIQSIQLCLATCFFCCLTAVTSDLPRIREEGFFVGYDKWTWITIGLNVVLGLRSDRIGFLWSVDCRRRELLGQHREGSLYVPLYGSFLFRYPLCECRRIVLNADCRNSSSTSICLPASLLERDSCSSLSSCTTSVEFQERTKKCSGRLLQETNRKGIIVSVRLWG